MDKKTEAIKRIIRTEVFTLANTLVAQFGGVSGEGDAPQFWECVKSLEYGEKDFETKEVFQWFIVSSWLFDILEEIEAVRAQWAGLCFWGRTSVEGSLENDQDLKKIAEALV